VFLKESSSNDSIIKYCSFEGAILEIENSVTIDHNKFQDRVIEISKNGSPSIKYNTFTATGGECLIIKDPTSIVAPIITYNEFQNIFAFGISLSVGDSPTIENNNITNCFAGGICWYNEDDPTNKLEIKGNYIADCANKVGVDTTGEQCSNVIYETYRITPVEGTGCGW